MKRHDVRGCDCGHTPFDHDSVLICEPCEDAFRMAADALADAVDRAGNMATPRMIEARDVYRKARGSSPSGLNESTAKALEWLGVDL